MPEGHTIHRLARDLRNDLKDQAIEATARQARFADGAARLDGEVLSDAEAYGKHLFVHFDSGDLLHVHLGLVGKFRRRSPSDDPSDALRVRLAAGDAAWDLTGAMTCALVDPDHRASVVEKLGPDPLRRDGRSGPFIDAVQSSKRPVALQLLDQSVIAGIGNVYRAEVLFLMGIHPKTPGDRLDADQLDTLWTLTRDLLRDGVRRNRIVTRTKDELPRGRITPSEALYAYKRAGMPCRRCEDKIARTEIANRKIWWCPTCQPA
ncbi:MAG TPA: DNA-formamidopyrimidine glycosylase family protein [Acidimicrobiales bacterium]|nr:DNA-formamidopyrimidine glycosylase family protein [Acidimicrobiales bacterium]